MSALLAFMATIMIFHLPGTWAVQAIGRTAGFWSRAAFAGLGLAGFTFIEQDSWTGGAGAALCFVLWGAWRHEKNHPKVSETRTVPVLAPGAVWIGGPGGGGSVPVDVEKPSKIGRWVNAHPRTAHRLATWPTAAVALLALRYWSGPLKALLLVGLLLLMDRLWDGRWA